ncbi:MAG: hypothetical protein QM784_36130 [Polyangiaceae bacterium]
MDLQLRTQTFRKRRRICLVTLAKKQQRTPRHMWMQSWKARSVQVRRIVHLLLFTSEAFAASLLWVIP